MTWFLMENKVVPREPGPLDHLSTENHNLPSSVRTCGQGHNSFLISYNTLYEIPLESSLAVPF